MSGLRAPSDYSQEPPRHPSLIVNSQVNSLILFYKFVVKVQIYCCCCCGCGGRRFEYAVLFMRDIYIYTAGTF